jgi:hypothetical protein
MNATMKLTACICSTFFMGCYSSAMVWPPGDDTEKIQLIITKDGTKYEFDTPPAFSNGVFVGVEKKRSVSIPLSSVSKTYSDGKIQFVVTNDSTKYQFDTPFTISDGVIVGDLTSKPVSIPLSEVPEVYVTRFNTVGMGLLVLGGSLLLTIGLGLMYFR